jgi:uncharacterized surface protein with fasciclin (FAS1) repeats
VQALPAHKNYCDERLNYCMKYMFLCETNIFMKKTFFSLMTTAAIAVVMTSCGSGETTTETKTDTPATEVTPPAPVAPATVVDIAVGSPDHSTLVTAVTTAGLVETLSGAGPFTVFAPTNAAFAALPAGTVEGLLKPESKADLTSILTYHVVAGSLKAADLTDGQKLKTVNGAELTVTIKDGKVMIDGANVTAADLTAGNGVVHVIDAVVMPKK